VRLSKDKLISNNVSPVYSKSIAFLLKCAAKYYIFPRTNFLKSIFM